MHRKFYSPFLFGFFKSCYMTISLGQGYFLTDENLPKGYPGIFLRSSDHQTSVLHFASDELVVVVNGIIRSDDLVRSLIKNNRVVLTKEEKRFVKRFRKEESTFPGCNKLPVKAH